VQPGIATPQTPAVELAAFDLGTADPAVLREALVDLRAGLPAGVTLTLGLGPGVFAPGRLGLEAVAPVALRPLPPFARDALDPAAGGGDLLLHLGAADPGAARAAAGAAAALLAGAAAPRWREAGRRGRGAAGFREGAGNVRVRDRLDRHVWTGRGDRTWMAGGTYLVYRRIELDREAWRALGSAGQDRVMGLHQRTGMHLGERRAHDPRPAGPRAPADAHVRLAAPAANGGAALWRRGYAGANALLFLAFMRDPRRQYVPVQRTLDAHDALTPHVTHTAAGVYAIPPAGDWLAAAGATAPR